MKRPNLIVSVTDWILILSAIVLFVLEMFALVGWVDFITDRFVRFSVFQLWIPVVIGILCGHFFPFTKKLQPNIRILLFTMTAGIIGYIIWYVVVDEETVIAALDLLANYLWAFFLSGYVLGTLLFPRPIHVLEK